MKTIEGKILLEVEKGCVEKVGDFVMPVDSKEYETGKVLSVGPKVEGVVVGDTVNFYTGAGYTITKEGKQYRVITSNEILVVL